MRIQEELKIDGVNLLEGVPPETGQGSVWGLSKNEDEEAFVKSS